MVDTAPAGKLPFAVSPDSMVASAPSMTALATSVISARVGRGLLIIDSSICVAQMTNLARRLHLEMIIFCANGTFEDGISIPTHSTRAAFKADVHTGEHHSVADA